MRSRLVFGALLMVAAGVSTVIGEEAVVPDDPSRFALYLLAGQSNMSGRGGVSEADRIADPRVLVLDRDDTWGCHGEPLHFDKPSSAVGPGFVFAKAMADQDPGVTIGLIPCAVGGTPIERWMPGGDLYEEAVRRAKIAQQRGTLRGILWHQGEANSKTEKNAKKYGIYLLKVVEGFRRDLQEPELPFVAGELGRFVYTRADKKYSFAKEVNRQLNALPEKAAYCGVVISEGLKDPGDEIHFDADSQRELGRRYAAAMLRLRKRKPGALEK